MELPETVMASPQLPADVGVSQPVGETPINQQGAQSLSSGSHDQRQPRLETDGWKLQQQFAFHDSNLSPALPLLPVNPGHGHSFTENSLFQQSDTEFAPLRAYPDISTESERFHFPPLDRTTHASEHDSLSQHPLALATILSDDGASSYCSLSLHSLSAGDQGRREEKAHSPATSSSNLTGHGEKDLETLNRPPDMSVDEAAKDETYFLRKDISAQRLMDLLQKDVGIPSSTSSAVSSASETSVKSTASFTGESKNTKVSKLVFDKSMVRREGPPGEVSVPQQQQPDRVSNPDQSRAQSSEVCNITVGSCSTQPDSSEVLHRELLSEVERRSSHEAESKNQQQNHPTTPSQPTTPYLKETSEGKTSGIRTNVGGVAYTGPFSANVERVQREHDLWSSGNQTGIDGSYLGFLPQSQSTPGVLKVPPKSSIKPKLGQLSAIESNKDSTYQSSTGISPQPAIPITDTQHTGTTNQCQEDDTSAEVQSLPSLNYMQKVDAWRTNQSSAKTSLFDSLALQGFSGISPKKKAYNAVSDTLNRILSQQARSLQQPLVSSAANQNAPQSSSTVPSGSSSPRRGEAVGSAPSENDNTGSAAPASPSPFGRSQSHSSLSTVVMPINKDQQTDRPPEKVEIQIQDDAHHHPSTTVQPSALMSLGHFSDVSLDRDLILSSSQDSYSGLQKGTSIGASSVVSLEIDNYAPYWTSKLSTPPPHPRSRELNIDERIPLYLHNLGIDQSPSTILTPFAPRGPIREPEFSPSDLCTIKGSTGTPTKSTQPSEVGSPHKGEYSRSSILSVDSSVSIPFSLDSLGPNVLTAEQARRTSPPSETEAVQSGHRPAACSRSDEDSHSSIWQHSQEQQSSSLTSSQTINQLGDKLDSDMGSCGERNLESLLQTSHPMEEAAKVSFVNSKAFSEIRKLLSHAENMVSTGSSAASSACPAAPRLHSDEDLSLSLRKKANRLQDSSFSSFTAGDPRTHTSLLGTRSSSDSMLMADKQRQSSIGQENMTSSWQPDYPSTRFTAPATVSYKPPEDSTGSSGTGTSLVLSKSVLRTEPEGCSAAPPDKVTKQPPVVNPPPGVSAQQLTSTPIDSAGVAEEEEKTTPGGPVQSGSSLSVLEDTDQEMSDDGSSQSSLAVRVARLLQSESSATMVSSTPSVTDQEESKARAWIKLKILGQQCEPLELNEEDRKRIEEFKKELLLKNPIKSQGSTDTESSAASSFSVSRQNNPPQPTTLSGDNNRPTQPLQSLSINPTDSTSQLLNAGRPDLEAQVCEIAAREGVTLPTKKPRALTSITITTCRRSTSPSPSTSPAPPLSLSPEPLHLTELSTEAVIPTAANRQISPHLEEDDRVALAQTSTREPQSMYDPSISLTSQSAQWSQKRQDTVGGQSEEPPVPLQGLDRENVIIRHDQAQSFRQASGANEAAESPVRTGHISHVHLTLSPKTTDHTLTTADHSSHPNAASRLPREEFVPLRHTSSAATSPDEGVGSSSPPEWHDTREPVRQQAPERSDTSTLFKTHVPQRKMTDMSTQSFIPRHRPKISPRPFATETPVPVLLPYKPHGSEELFYIPQAEADVSSAEPSDTTMESSHSGSDDAVPPRFSSEVLGHRDPGLDRGVTIRHTEGIYSKRLKTATFKMQEPENRAAGKSVSQTPKPSSQVSVAFTRVPLSSKQEVFKRDQGTSPIHFLGYDQPEPSCDRFQPVHLVQTSIPQMGLDRDQQRAGSDVPQPASQQSTLDQLWQKFCDGWTAEESCPTSDREVSLLERLERLSRLIHSTRSANVSEAQEEEDCPPGQKLGRKREDVAARGKERGEDFGEIKRRIRGEAREKEWKVREGKSGKSPVQRRLHGEETSQPAEDNSRASFSSSSISHSSSQSQHFSPADRDESDTMSTMSGSMSTVDTARLIRAFGAHKVQHLKATSNLSKLYSTINKQKEEREQRGRNGDPSHIITPSETTDESVVADSTSSTSFYAVPPHHGPSRTLAAKKAVKLVNKGIQAGDLEIVRNGTRRHTRDVGTTFPSPGETRAFSQSSSSIMRVKTGQRSPSKSQGLQKQRKSKRSPSKPYPAGVSWFISADNLRSEARKENQPEEGSSSWRPSTAWFEPYSRIHPWREPLRLRQVHEDRNKEPSFIHDTEFDPDPRSKTMSGLARITLQEALEMSRPQFLSRSRQRVKRLALQVEERKLQAVFSREREQIFNMPGVSERLPRPAGMVLLRKAVPRKEMIQRSKRIYENLSEVQRRREEERRKADYRLYRLNAQLYNKRITNHVLGRRSAWQ